MLSNWFKLLLLAPLASLGHSNTFFETRIQYRPSFQNSLDFQWGKRYFAGPVLFDFMGGGDLYFNQHLGLQVALRSETVILESYFRILTSIHETFHSEVFHRTTFFGGIYSESPRTFIQGFIEFGRYFRSYSHYNIPLPCAKSAYWDQDWGGTLGMKANLYPWEMHLKISTIQSSGFVERLNNPYAEIKVVRNLGNHLFEVFYQYQVVLGFGNLGRMALGGKTAILF